MGRGRYLGFIDADGDISPEFLAPFVSIMRSEEPDIIIGSKRHPDSSVHYPPLRRLYSWGYQHLIHLLFRLNVKDTQVGIKLVDRKVIADVLPLLRESRFALDLELLVLARRLGYTQIVEAPVRDRGAVRQHHLPQGRVAAPRRHARPLRPLLRPPRVRRRDRGPARRAPTPAAAALGPAPRAGADRTGPSRPRRSGRTLDVESQFRAGLYGRRDQVPHDPTAIRNVALVGHHGAGKTTLAEALLAATGSIARRGSVEKGTTVMDFEPEEVARQLSISTSLAPFTVNGVKVNLLDTPGYADFAGEMVTALANVDLAVVVVSATDGVQAQTEDAWRAAARLGVPRVIVINKLDRERADFDRTLAEIRATFGAGVAPVELPIGHEADFHGVIDLLDDTATHYDTPGRGRGGRRHRPAGRARGPHPRRPRRRGAHRPRAARRGHRGGRRRPHGALPQRRDARLRRAREEPGRRRRLGQRLPGAVLLGRERGRGRPAGPPDRGAVPEPRPRARPVLATAGTETVEIPSDPAGQTVLTVTKTYNDGHTGKMSLCKVVSGTLQPDAVLVNSRTREEERLHALQSIAGPRHRPGHERRGGRLRGGAPAERDAHRRHPGAQGPARRRAAARAAGARAAGRGEAGDAGRRRQADVGACSGCATRTRRSP